ncbi:MAG: GNAT family N-acetyltransferase [Boseongicola sp.]
MQPSTKYNVRWAENASDLKAAQRLRYRAFIAKSGAMDRLNGRDSDDFDKICSHILIEEVTTGHLVATFRVLSLASGADIGQSYSAQYYALEALENFKAPMAEMGRFCIEPGQTDPDILRVAWGALTTFVDRESVGMLFGCSSFKGTKTSNYSDAFAVLRDRYLAPKRWWPKTKAPNVFQFARLLRRSPDRSLAFKTMPPLLRSYLRMGGWVSDHAVVDRDLNTLHVFTGLEIGTIPAARAKALRALAL